MYYIWIENEKEKNIKHLKSNQHDEGLLVVLGRERKEKKWKNS